jgi:hypothetical protein
MVKTQKHNQVTWLRDSMFGCSVTPLGMQWLRILEGTHFMVRLCLGVGNHWGRDSVCGKELTLQRELLSVGKGTHFTERPSLTIGRKTLSRGTDSDRGKELTLLRDRLCGNSLYRGSYSLSKELTLQRDRLWLWEGTHFPDGPSLAVVRNTLCRGN